MCLYLVREIYFKESAHTVVEPGKSKVCRVGQQAGGPKRVTVQVQRWSAGKIPSYSGEISLCSTQALNRLGEAHHK